MTLAAGAAAVLAAGLGLPGAARAGTIPAAGALAPAVPQKSTVVAGYDQLGCHAKGYPVYAQIQGTIIAPAPGARMFSGYSADIVNIGGVASGVSAGVAVEIEEGGAVYTPYGQWGSAQVDASFYAKRGDKLEVTILNKGSSGWLVRIVDETSGTKWSAVKRDPGDHRCQAGAYEVGPSPVYDDLSQTKPIAFDFTRVWWTERGRAGAGKLLGTPPPGATLHRYNLVDIHGTTVAATSAPADRGNNFTVTDAIPTLYTPNLAGYEVTQAHSPDPYTGVQATWRIPKITKTDPGSYAFAYYFVGIGNAQGSGVMAGVVATMDYGSVSYHPFIDWGAQLAVFQEMAFTPGDKIRALIVRTAQVWNFQVFDQTTGQGSGASEAAVVSPYDAEVAELRAANPLGPGYLPLAATTPVTFDHATFTDAAGKTYPFETVVPFGSVLRLYMENSSGTKTIAATSQPDSDRDGFTVQDGATAPASPKS